ncbi:hypothetical protein [Corynebacterium diphtheriae]|uniref:hypothetical protein n=1 Tax=Corynebacterium diphtheriae TaxID=1717 RepID=UPI0013C71871|nr:hypothetical protein [Corynebacterium diphtheriae]CAB0628032.1 phage tail protein [Corynebacterium diphtheriae]CAB0639197.1 phage tail protein [Corynebacterium diphtheriae]
MAVNVANAFVANPPIDGGVYFNAPLGAKLPTTADEALDSKFVDHGAVGEDGFNVNPKRESSTEKMFGGEDWVDIQTSYTEEATITLLEDDNINVIKSIYGDENVVETPADSNNGLRRTIYHTQKRLPIKSHVLKAVDGEKRKVIVIPRGRISSVEKTADVHSASTKYNVTITCFKGPEEHKYAYAYELRDDGVVMLGGEDLGGAEEAVSGGKKITLPSGVTGGTFTVSVNGKPSAAINHDATGTAVKLIVNKVAGGESAKVTGRSGGPYTISGVEGEVTADGSNLEGVENTTITVA